MPPKGRSTKVAVDVTLPDDLLSDPIVTPVPAGVDSEEQGPADTVNTTSDKAAGHGSAMLTAAAAVAGRSGLSVEEKSQMHEAPVPAAEDFLEDDSDEELDIDIAKEDAFRLRFTAILLIPMVLLQEIKAIIAAVRLLMTKVCNREEWICTQVCCGKAKGKTFMAAADHITSATHLLNLEKLGTATKASMDKSILASLKNDYGF
ncbi:unnamed protein product [Closterium sp. NIES-64]|nr:unnamed protein product [Closterium sp. NIES-64]